MLVGQLVGQLVGRSVGRSVGWSVSPPLRSEIFHQPLDG